MKHPRVSTPVLAGAIPRAGIVEKLTTIEGRRTTGLLKWSGATQGEVALVCGQIASEQKERADGRDPVELLLEERSGTFEVFQILPPLPVSKGKDGLRRGSLEVHVAADLMNYCESAGLTGLLAIEHAGQRAEIGYDRGELGDIRLDGLDELHEVFAWEDGSFEIVALALAPNLVGDLENAITTEMVRPDLFVPEPSKADTTGKQLLRVVEMTLAEIVKEREERRPVTKTSPPVMPLAAPKKHPTLPPPSLPAKPTREPTVRVFYLRGDGEAPKDEGVRHVSKTVSREEALPDARPARRSEPAPELVDELEGAFDDDRDHDERDHDERDHDDRDHDEPVHDDSLPPARRPSLERIRHEDDAQVVEVERKKGSPSTAAATTLEEARSARRAARPSDDTVKTTKERPVTTPALAPAAAAPTPEKKPLPTFVWALVSLAIVIGSLVFLSMLPPIE